MNSFIIERNGMKPSCFSTELSVELERLVKDLKPLKGSIYCKYFKTLGKNKCLKNTQV